MHEVNTELDPIAFRLAFGVIVVLIGMKQAQLVTGNVNYLTVWQILTALMVFGHFYGSVRNFLWLYDQDFPCFLGESSRTPPTTTTGGSNTPPLSLSLSVSLPTLMLRLQATRPKASTGSALGASFSWGRSPRWCTSFARPTFCTRGRGTR